MEKGKIIMNKKIEKLGQDPAFPNVAFDSEGCFTHCEDEGHFGMSKRFYAACKAMQGICVNAGRNGHTFSKIDEIVKISYEIADELLKQENE